MQIFISHIAEEKLLALEIKKQIETAFLKEIDMFVSSDPDDISAGEDWLKKIRKAINCSDLLIILYSHQSAFRPWINFEAGCGWIKKIPIIPICHSGLKISELGHIAPISSLRCLDMESPDFTKLFFDAITNHTKFKQAPVVSSEEFMKAVKGAIGGVECKVTKARLDQDAKIKTQENIKAIMAQALSKLNDPAKIEEIDDGWKAHFYDKCKNVSDKEMQELWSNIFLGEANAPGTYLQRTLDLVSSLDKKEANLFKVLCSFAILHENNLSPLILNINDAIYSKAGLDYQNIAYLDTIGLVKFKGSTHFVGERMSNVEVCDYYGTKVMFTFKKTSGNELPIGKVLFTVAGKQLAPICGSEMNPEFIKYIMECYNNKSGGGDDVVSMTIIE